MMSGKSKDALCLLSLMLMERFFLSILMSLVRKHPKKKPPVSSTLVDGIADTPHSVFFDQLDAVHMRRVALKLYGAAGPSGLDVSAWRRTYTCALLF